MRESVTGKAGYNIYLGKHGVDVGVFPNSGNPILPPTKNRFHWAFRHPPG